MYIYIYIYTYVCIGTSCSWTRTTRPLRFGERRRPLPTRLRWSALCS